MAQSSGANVPKFGSFKPRANNKNLTSTLNREPTSGRNERNHDENRRRDRGIDDSSGDRPEKREAHGSRHQRSRSPKQARHEFDEEPEPFIIDLRGDPKNVEYGCLHRYTIPAYRRSGHGSVIGAPSNVKIDRKLSTDKEIVLSTVNRPAGDRRVLSSKKGDVARKDTRELSFAEGDSMQMEEDFLSFKRERSPDDDKMPTEVGVGIWNFIEAADNSDE